MKENKFLLILLLHCVICFPQKENNIWYFGNKAGLDFNSGTPVNLTDGEIVTTEGCATISNSSGQLLFYTDGITVYNRNHTIMPNGSGLKGHPSSTQSAVIVPKPNSNTIYYIFTTTHRAESDGIRFSEVDISLDGGLGDVTTNKNIPLYTPTCEKICAVKDNTTGNYWVVTHGFENNAFLAFKIDATGVTTAPVISNSGSIIGSVNVFEIFNAQGYLKFSPNGSKLVCVNTYIAVELFDFNLQTGLIDNAVTVNSFGQNRFGYGGEFSPSGNLLYVTSSLNPSSNQSRVYQYNLLSSNIAASEIQVNTSTVNGIGALQLASNCKIYGANSSAVLGNNSLYVINNPDILGVNCSLQSSNVVLSGRCSIGLPQFIEYSVCKNRTINNDDVCLGSSTTFALGGSENINTGFWNFGDGNTSNSINGINQYSAAGTYIITGDFTTPTGNFSISKQIFIPENPIAHTVTEITICQPLVATYDLNQINATVLQNQSNTIYGVSYFSSQAEALSHSNILTPMQTFTTQTTTIFAKVYRLSNFDCHSITSFTIRLSDYPALNSISDYNTCDDGILDDGIATFDLSTKTAEFLNGQSPNDFKVSYHLTPADAQNDTNPILTVLNNVTNPQTIYARIATLPSAKCYHMATFSLIVEQNPQPTIQPTYHLCEGDGNFISINLPNSFSSYLWSDGTQTNSFSTSQPGNYWVTVTQNANGLICSRTSDFQVVLSNEPTIKEIKFEDWTDSQNSILILVDAISIGDYEYSLDGVNYQDSNYFEQLIANKYTVHVRDKNGCGISTDEIFLLIYPKFFTPNNDGYNDTWRIEFSESEPNLNLRIFDRYGKLINTSKSWDGNLNGKPLPSADYWFSVIRENGKQLKGHFTLKR